MADSSLYVESTVFLVEFFEHVGCILLLTLKEK